ncbi:unnamed protein product [Nesidiocoris tenuis]|uniref:Uncharacterized protein n=1 Tax=Nesidiocoris tenuis TaxID=355587 RepID=A0A6H5FVZ7_9HEMI|nr:unnamed protein product [Nesidiocoris tenuis]
MTCHRLHAMYRRSRTMYRRNIENEKRSDSMETENPGRRRRHNSLSFMVQKRCGSCKPTVDLDNENQPKERLSLLKSRRQLNELRPHAEVRSLLESIVSIERTVAPTYRLCRICNLSFQRTAPLHKYLHQHQDLGKCSLKTTHRSPCPSGAFKYCRSKFGPVPSNSDSENLD